MKRLTDKIGWVSGGCSGMGLGTVEVLLREGAKVVVADVQLEKGRTLESKYPGRVIFTPCDVTREADIAASIRAAQNGFGGLDVMFNNAGGPASTKPIEELTTEDWEYGDSLLLRSTMLACKYAVPLMKARGGGAIVNNSSGTAVLTYGFGLVYGTMKAGVLNFTKLLAAELAPHRIRVNVLIPGFVLTSIAGRALGVPPEVADLMIPHLQEHHKSMQPLPLTGQPEDIGEAVSFLVSDASRWITGVALPVDGGMLVATQRQHSLSDTESYMNAITRARDRVYREHPQLRSEKK